MTGRPTHDQLERALKDAAAAHHDYESDALGGVRDTQWAGFYAAFVLGQVGPVMGASALSRTLEAVTAEDDWTAVAARAVLDRDD